MMSAHAVPAKRSRERWELPALSRYVRHGPESLGAGSGLGMRSSRGDAGGRSWSPPTVFNRGVNEIRGRVGSRARLGPIAATDPLSGR